MKVHISDKQQYFSISMSQILPGTHSCGKLFTAYLKLKFNRASVFVFSKSGKPIHEGFEPCLQKDCVRLQIAENLTAVRQGLCVFVLVTKTQRQAVEAGQPSGTQASLLFLSSLLLLVAS